MRTVYACVLDVNIKPPETSAQGFERLWKIASQWVETQYRERWHINCQVAANQPRLAPLPQHGVVAQRESVAGVCELISLEWSYPDQQDPGMQWIIACQLARNGPRLEASIAIRIASTLTIAKPLNYNLKRPGLVDLIVQNFTCFIGKSAIPLKPRELDRDDAELFVEDTLCASERWLPVIAISPEQGMRDYLLDPVELQQTLLGHAQVVAFRDVAAGRAWTDALKNKELSCYLGAVRLYWPGFNLRQAPGASALSGRLDSLAHRAATTAGAASVSHAGGRFGLSLLKPADRPDGARRDRSRQGRPLPDDDQELEST